MNYLKSRIVLEKNSVHKTTSLAIATILVTAMFVGIIPIVPAYAANTYLTVSSTNLNTNTIQVMVHDPALAAAPTVTITSAAGSTPVTMYKDILGDYIGYITKSGVTAVHSNPPAPNPGTSADNAIDFGTASTTTITYAERGETATISIGPTSPSNLAADRTTIPPRAKIYVTFSNPTANLDPTSADTTSPSVTVALNGVNVTAFTTISTFQETTANSGNFTASITLTNTTKNGDLISVIIGTTRVDLPVVVSNGILTAPATITYSQGVNITLTDPDKNLDTKQVETLAGKNVTVQMKIGANLVNQTLTVKETGKNTGVFLGTVNIIINATKGVSAPGTTLTFGVPVGSTATFTSTFNDTDSNIVGYKSQAITSLSLASATIALDKTAYGPAPSIPAILTLTEPNANDESASVELLTVSNGTNSFGLNVIHSTSAQKIGTLNVTSTSSSGVTTTLKISSNLQFVETGPNTGIFNMVIDLGTQLSGKRSAGDTLTFSYFDLFKKTTVTVTVTMGGAVSTITLDRPVLPMPLGQTVTTKVTVTDPKANTNAFSVDAINVVLVPLNATNQKLKFNNTNTATIQLIETGVNTGIFTATVQYKIAGANGPVYVIPTSGISYTLRRMETNMTIKGTEMINGRLNFVYNDSLATGGNVTAMGIIKPSTATLTVSPASVNLNQTVIVTVNDQDMQLSSTVNNTIHVNVFSGTTTLTPLGPLTLTETGTTTGVFTASATVGEDIPFDTALPGDSFTVKYIDNTTATSYYGTGFNTATLTGSFSVPTHTAVIAINSQSFGPFSKVVINVTDPDLVFTAPSQVLLARIQTSKQVLQNVPATKSLGNGAFQWTFNLNGTIGTTNPLTVAPVDKINAYYVDNVDAAGNTGVILSVTATVNSMTGIVTITPSSVVPGQYFNLTVTDSDQNKDGTVIEAVTATVTSTSWPIGVTITLPETAPNSGVFSAQVQVTTGLPSGNQIRAVTGDTVTAVYTDPWSVTGTTAKVNATMVVGAAQIATQRVPAGTPKLVDTTGNAVTAPAAGSLVVVQATVRNNASSTQTFTYIVQVKNANGQVVFLNWIQNMTLSVGQSSTPGISWTPSASGTYTIQVFVWNSLTGAQALSPQVSQTVIVS